MILRNPIRTSQILLADCEYKENIWIKKYKELIYKAKCRIRIRNLIIVNCIRSLITILLLAALVIGVYLMENINCGNLPTLLGILIGFVLFINWEYWYFGFETCTTFIKFKHRGKIY